MRHHPAPVFIIVSKAAHLCIAAVIHCRQCVSTLVMAGISTTGVVLSSVAWASDADYDVRLVQDCCYDPDRDAHEALLRSGFGGRVQVV
nr:isochorismatase family protein [Escherichia coli]